MNEDNKMNQDNKVVGLAPNQYVTYMYYALLASAAIGAISMVLAFVGIFFLGSIGSLLGFAGLIMAGLGMFVFKDKFDEVQGTHFKYLLIVTLVFTLVFMAFGIVMGILGVTIGSIVGLVMSFIYILILFSCYKLWCNGAALSPDAIKAKALGVVGR